MLSKKAKYAIKALLRLADHQRGEPMRIADLARAEQIPPKFLEAVIRHVRAFGPVVRLELDLVEGGTIEAHIPRARFQGLGLAKGQQVYVSPTNVRVFADPS